MSTKYSVSARKRWQLDGDRPRLTDHVVGSSEHGPGQWDRRTPSWSVAPETAWQEGIDLQPSVVQWFETDHQPPLERVRLFGERDPTQEIRQYGAAFLVVDQNERAAVTVVTIDMLNDPARRAYLWTRVQQHFGTGGGDS